MGVLTLVVGFLPVLLFLAALILMDSYKLVSRRSVALALGAGMAAALVSLLLNRLLLDRGIDATLLKRYAGPLLEETVKAIYVVYLIRSAHVGFLVDSAILGFAVGTGFAVVENICYAGVVGDLGLGLWLVRGLGTAVMHGSTTAVLAILSKSLADRRETASPAIVLPGLLLAFTAHSLFNHLILHPLVSTALLLIAMPLLVVLVFERSGRATRDWLGVSLDTDVELLDSIESGHVEETPAGAYLSTLSRLPGPVVADMLCYLRIHLELSLRAKGILIARAAGVDLPIDDEVRADFRELRFLERSIGKTGKMALQPFLRSSTRDLWQLYVLDE